MSRAKCPGCARESFDHSDSELKQFHPKRWEFENATTKVGFTKDFNSNLEAIMRDVMETHGARVMAYVKRKAWGNYCLYAIDEPDGEAITQQRMAFDLGISKQAASAVVQFYKARGHLRDDVGKLLYPVLAPSLRPPPDKSQTLPDFSTFVLHWKVKNSSDWEALEVARSTVKKLNKVILSDYRQSRRSATNAGALKEESYESHEKGNVAPPSSSSPSAAPDREEEEDPITPILEAFKPIRTTDSKVRDLIRDCGGATVQEIVARAIGEDPTAIKRNRAIRDPQRFLISQLREFFHSPAALKQWRREREEVADQEAAAERSAEERRAALLAMLEEEDEKAGGASS